MTSARGPDWDFYQCKCGNIVFEYNTITGEKCLSDTWKECTVNCMEPVTHVPPTARPFTTITIPVSRPRKHMATQTNEDINTRSVETQTVSTANCPCHEHSTVLATSSDVGSIGKEKSKSFCTNTTEDYEEKDGQKEELEINESKKDKKSKANEKAVVPKPTTEADRVLRKRKTNKADGTNAGQEVNKKSKTSKKKA